MPMLFEVLVKVLQTVANPRKAKDSGNVATKVAKVLSLKARRANLITLCLQQARMQLILTGNSRKNGETIWLLLEIVMQLQQLMLKVFTC
jgi:hypothetical protein